MDLNLPSIAVTHTKNRQNPGETFWLDDIPCKTFRSSSVQKCFLSSEFLASDLKSLFFLKSVSDINPIICMQYRNASPLSQATQAFFISFTFTCLNACDDASNLLLKVFHSKAFVPRISLLSHTQFRLAIRRLQIRTSDK